MSTGEHLSDEIDGMPTVLEDEGVPKLGIAISLAGIAALALLFFFVDPLHESVLAAFRGDHEEVRRQIDSLGWTAPLIILALCMLHAVLFFPAEIVDAAAGFAFGFWPALGLVMVGWLLNALLAYGIGHSLARPLLWRIVGHERFERAERAIERGGVTLLLTIRLVPIVPFSLACYAAGAARVPLWRFMWTTAVGYLPITVISVYLGTRLEDFSLTDPLILGSAAVFIGLVFVAHFIIPRGDDEAHS